MAAKGSKLKITFNDDGSCSTDGTGLVGSEKELLEDLQALAAELGAELKVEKHVHKHGVHTHTHTHTHVKQKG